MCGKKTLFLPTIPELLFSSLYSYFSGIRTNRRFFTDLENPDLLEFSKTFIDPGEF
jgi:hypothetical protein